MIKKLFCIMIILVLILSLFSINVFAADAELVYDEDFEYGVTDIVSTDKCGSVSIVEEEGNNNHILRVKGNDINYSQTPFGPYVADADFSVRVKQNSYGGQKRWSKILIRSEWGEYWTYQLNLYNYQTTVSYNDTTTKTSEVIATNPNVEFLDNVWHTVQIFTRGNKITICIDGKKVLSFESDYKSEGCFGFVTWQTDLEVDDISITEYADGKAPDVSTLIPPQPESTDMQIIENEPVKRDNVKSVVSVSKTVNNNSLLKTILTVITFSVSAASLIMIILLLFSGKKVKKNGDDLEKG